MAETIAVRGLEFFIENRTTGEDGGPSLQLRGTVDGSKVQLLRFDMFHKGPHYHYAPMGQNIRYDLDPLTVDDGIGWCVGLLGSKLGDLVAKAGYPQLVGPDDAAAVTQALPDIERRWRSLC